MKQVSPSARPLRVPFSGASSTLVMSRSSPSASFTFTQTSRGTFTPVLVKSVSMDVLLPSVMMGASFTGFTVITTTAVSHSAGSGTPRSHTT